MDRKQLKGKIKNLPVNVGIVGLALLLGVAERGTVLFSEILKGPGRGRIAAGYKRILEIKDFWNYYDELRNLSTESARVTIWRLQKKGLVAKNKKYYHLTSLGLEMVKIFQEQKPEKKWDGRWRLVVFDIPEKERGWRDWLRYQLAVFDYKPLQKSVFIGQQPLNEDIYNEIIERKLDSYIRLLTVGEIDNEDF